MNLHLLGAIGGFGWLLASLALAQETPQIITHPRSQSVSLGANVTLRATASPSAGVSFRWQHDHGDVPDATSAALAITNVTLLDAGEYMAIASNDAGSAMSKPATLQVDPTFFKITSGPVATDGGESSGALWGDFDGDGWPDLFVGNSPGRNALYRNNQDGTFTKLTTLAPTKDSGFGGAWGDFNNDGWPDLFVADNGLNFLYRNNGDGTFTKVTPFAGSAGATSWSGTWADYDRDGWLDLFIANGGGNNDVLLHNNRDGTFTRITATPLSKSGGTSIAGSWADYDRDGWPDLFVANNGGMNFLFRNLRDGGFTRVTTGRIATDAQSSIVADWGDYDGDGWPDLAVGVFGKCLLYRNLGDGGFARQTNGPIVLDTQNSELVQWGDYDNDGWLDLFSANDGGQNNSLYHNNGDGTFTKVTTGSPVNDGGSSAGASWTDYDNDGFLDLFVANWQGSGHNFLYRNARNANHWLKVRCVGSASNRSAIGAKVWVTARIGGAERTQLREISGGIGFGQMDLAAHLGLGDADSVTLIRIEWPSGITQTLGPLTVNQLVTVHEPPRVRSFRQESGSWHLEFLGVPGGQYWLEESPDLASWTAVQSIAASTQPGQFEAVIGGGDEARGFFRVVER